MPWVQRDVTNNICGVYANRQPGIADEQLAESDTTLIAFMNPPIQSVLSQDLMAQFTTTDVATIMIALDNEAAQAKSDAAAAKTPSAPLNQLWAALQAQKDPMQVTNARFKAGWAALVQILSQNRMNAIATALGITIV